jgi:hypothetical protein
VSAPRRSQLDGGDANSTGGTRNKDSLSGPQLPLSDESVERGGERFGESTRFGPRDFVGDLKEVLGGHDAV